MQYKLTFRNARILNFSKVFLVGDRHTMGKGGLRDSDRAERDRALIDYIFVLMYVTESGYLCAGTSFHLSWAGLNASILLSLS